MFFGSLNQYKIMVPLFGAAMLHQIKAPHYAAPKKAPQFYADYLKLISLVMDSSFSEVKF